MSLFLTLGAVAQIDTNKSYRIKCQMGYLNALNYDAHETGPVGGVNVVSLDESSDDQIFTFEAYGESYKLKTQSDKYVYCQSWNVDALSTGSALTFLDAGDNSYKIYCSKGYFKVESVSSVYYVFCNAAENQAAIWTLEEVNDGGTVEPEPEPEPDPTPTPADPTEFYNSIGKPSFSRGGNTSLVAQVVFDGNKNITDFTYIQGQVNRVNSVINVEAGKEYSLDITYELNFGCLGIFQIHGSGDNVVAEKKYGYYSSVWRANNHDPLSLLEENSEKIASELGVAFSDLDKFVVGGNQYLTLPYKITIPENLTPGEFVVVRVMVGRTGNNNTYDEKGIAEGGCLDIIFHIEKSALPVKLTQITAQDELLYGLEGYIGTFSAPYATAIPDGVTAYYAQSNSEDVISLTPIEGSNVVPANFGVILVANSDKVTMSPSSEAGNTSMNNVLGNTASGPVKMQSGDYILTRPSGYSAGFYPATGTLAANKAFLRLGNANTSALRLVVDETTVIENVVTEKANGAIYDLTGRRVLNTVKGGVYIQNGKKFIVK